MLYRQKLILTYTLVKTIFAPVGHLLRYAFILNYYLLAREVWLITNHTNESLNASKTLTPSFDASRSD